MLSTTRESDAAPRAKTQRTGFAAGEGDCRRSGEASPRRRHAVAGALLAGALLASPMPAVAQPGPGGFGIAEPDRTRMEIVAHFGGPVNAVAVEGTTAVAAIGTRVVVLDVADRSSPARRAAVDLSFIVRDVEMRDGHAYITTQGDIQVGNDHTVVVLDVSDPADPQAVLEFAYLDGANARRHTEIVLFGDYAYVLNNVSNLDIFDIIDPANPLHLGEFTIGLGNNPIDMTEDGGLLYVLDGDGLVQIFDLVADPLLPPLCGDAPVGGVVTAIDAEGGYACVCALNTNNLYASILWVLNVFDCTNPFIVGSVNDLILPMDVSLTDGYAFVADHTISGWDGDTGGPWWDLSKGLAVYDVEANPPSPALVANRKTHGATRGVEVIGSTAYTFDDGEGLILWDAIDPTDPARLGHHHSPASLRQMARDGTLLYITDEWNGFTVLDVADPRSPAVLGVYQASQSGRANHFGIAVRDGWACFAAGLGGIEVVDVSDPSSPVLASQPPVTEDTQTGAIEFDGAYARVGIGNRLFNFDITALPQVQELGSLNTFSLPYTIATSDEAISHIARARHFVVDNSDPSNPVQCLSDLSVRAADLVLAGDILYLAHKFDLGDGGGFYVRDVSEGCAPQTIWTYPANRAAAVSVQGHRAYMTAGDPDNGMLGALYVFDVSDPFAPSFLAKMPLPGANNAAQEGSLDILAVPGVAYVTTTQGLVVTEIGPKRTPARVSPGGP